jgi:hypothetical protein
MGFVATRSGSSTELYSESDRLSLLSYYAGMPVGYGWWRKDPLVRRCINLRATWATKAGFETILEPTIDIPKDQWEEYLKPYLELKTYIDQCNKKVNLDKRLRNWLIKAKRDGKAVYQIVWTGEKDATTNQPTGDPKALIPLRADRVEPCLDDDWTFLGIKYKGVGSRKQPKYTANELIYICNDDVEEDYVGVSDVEPILPDLYTRDKIRNEDMPEAVTTLWAPVAIWRINRESLPIGMSDADVGILLAAHIAAIKPGKHIATTTQFDPPTIVNINPDLTKMVEVKRDLAREIIQNFEVPRFIVSYEEDVNRATSGNVIKAFVDGPVTDDQRSQKRDIEAQWYDKLTRIWLTRKNLLKEDKPPVKVIHQANILNFTDFMDLMKTTAIAYNGGMGFVDMEKAYEIMQRGALTEFDPKELQPPAGPPK